ncbi:MULTISPECIES: sigma 54 modulation/S30EA ribosomal C-terminal domain-containing protein [unclassified Mycobacterium]|uniref:sigma 54 modulation/S30EA ribosomal C-terminal domain-containing protein n=1 Tax=unclassified Mycobacterium TaxID=2642494 RepID=UPI002742584B|nr:MULTISPECIES: sigma 54 modulation/S30EA ribosomal C-terminal domain-containing protein [unclassified Mycobacterium]MDP7707245.1 sigma 54 modulation/S30EA ribosomal C-terminal domain-containing protein [Mycobacterium sp. TY815]MDP7723846.1 sigma 54 modulation/S30EA ribosomal C-terminal domain-containing protein [Mycobacterium sp. TY814]
MKALEVVREFPDVDVTSCGPVTAVQADRVAQAVGEVLASHEITGGARVRLKTGICGRGPMVMQVNLSVGELPARVAAVTAGIDDLSPALERLDRHIGRMLAPWQPRPWPDPARRILTVGDDAVITRRKNVALQRTTPLQAVAVMDGMDYDAHLFTDVETGEDALVYRAGPSGLRLARQWHVFPPGWAWSPGIPGPQLPLIVNSRATPTLSESDAVRRACEHSLPLLFYTDRETGRGHMLYPRHDGNLGLLVPTK